VVPFTAVKAIAKKVDWSETDTLPGFPLKRDRFRACIAKPESTYSTVKIPGAPKAYGSYVRAGHFNYVRVFGSGHMISERNPAASKHLFETWVNPSTRGTFGECTP